MSSETFNALLLDISNQLKEEDLSKMKFLVRDHVGKRDLERIASGHGLFQALAERGHLGPEKLDFLIGVLQGIPRVDLSEKLQQFAGSERAANGGPSEEETGTEPESEPPVCHCASRGRCCPRDVEQSGTEPATPP